ncbi:hypothetical protein WN944_014626 [Citrus x changshan-huyou]|uniref:YDG domain-containing protein n=1 Tax=Citrus x changshan-huyou TaxID=2935761 RepID=A0AAP0MAX6_9ROSI
MSVVVNFYDFFYFSINHSVLFLLPFYWNAFSIEVLSCLQLLTCLNGDKYSGGRDLSGNKRTNKNQSFDQKFLKLNEALRVSCKKGYPVRVVRSFKEKRSSYAPEKGLRYDGIYRIEECWRKIGVQGFKVCRYLFVRCDNDPAPWTSDDHGDHPRPLPELPELKNALDITKRKERPLWDFDELDGCWKWIKPPPLSRVVAHTGKSDGKKSITVREKLLKGLFSIPYPHLQ